MVNKKGFKAEVVLGSGGNFYEQGRSVPTVGKLNELLNAVCPNTDLGISESQV